VSDGTDGARAPEARPGRGRRFPWAVVAVAVVLGLFFAWDVVEAVGNLVAVPQDARYANNDFYRENGLDGLVAQPPWPALVAGVLVPPVAYVLALRAGRRRGAGVLALTLVTGLAVSAALTLTITAYVTSI